MSKETGGSAFPVPATEYHGCDFGMDLRDYFAASAMQGFLSSGTKFSLGPSHKEAMDSSAVTLYLMADAMLKARIG
mgnify:CR=1 FL=1